MEKANLKRFTVKSKVLKFIKRNYKAYLFLMPLILGILIFTLYPMLSSLYYSFFDYKVITPPKNFGLQNYLRIFGAGSKNFLQSIKVTSIYTVITVPLGMFLSFLLALFLNQKVKGIKFFRLLYYMPVIIPVVVSGLIWRDIADTQYGIGNAIITGLGLPEFAFFTKAETSMLSLILFGLFNTGGGMILWIAALNNVSPTLYESASIEGAGKLRKLITITIPLCTPTMFYMLITGIIGSLQTFGCVVVVTGSAAGVRDSLLFYVMNVYNEAMGSFRMGYACALSWVLFIVIGVLTLIMFRTSKWVFYGEE